MGAQRSLVFTTEKRCFASLTPSPPPRPAIPLLNPSSLLRPQPYPFHFVACSIMSAFLFLHLHTVPLFDSSHYTVVHQRFFLQGKKKCQYNDFAVSAATKTSDDSEVIVQSGARTPTTLPRKPLPSCFHSHQFLAFRFSRAESRTTLLLRTKHFCTQRQTHTPSIGLSGTFLKTLPDLVTPLMGHSLSPRSCPPTQKKKEFRLDSNDCGFYLCRCKLCWRL